MGATHPVHVLGSGLGREHGEDPRPAAHIQHHLVLEGMLVVVHGVPVGQGPDLVLQHFLIGTEGGRGTMEVSFPYECFTREALVLVR